MALGQLVLGAWVPEAELAARGEAYVKSRSLFLGNLAQLDDERPDRAEELERLLDDCLLIVSLGCPWAQRVLLARRLGSNGANLEVVIVPPELGDEGWRLPQVERCVPGAPPYVHCLYTRSFAHYTGRVTLPLLWSTSEQRILSNDSAELMRLLGGVKLRPAHLSDEVDHWSRWLQSNVNIGPYRAGFAGSQALYEEAVLALFESLDVLEAHLTSRAYLCGGQLTEADLRLLPTLIRFDVAYYGHFQCNLRPLSAYRALSAYLTRLSDRPEVRETTSIEHIERHYLGSVPKSRHTPLSLAPLS